MNEEWWERPACVACDYWWAFLLALVLGLAAYFTRDYWLPASTTLGTGDVQVTLRWSGLNDLDLHVTDPAGETIFYQHRRAASGGELDVDSNAGCAEQVTETPVENVFWPDGSAPRGRFRIAVQYYQQCTDPAHTPFEVRLLVDGDVQEFTGEVGNQDEQVMVTEFER